MRPGYLAIALTYVTLAAGEVTLHWYMAQESVPARRARETYLHRDPQNGKQYVAGLVDGVLPALILGTAVGSIGSRWTPREFLCCLGLVSVGAVALLPVYASLLPEARFGWWGATLGERIKGMIFGSINLGGLCFAFALVSCLVTQSIQKGKVDDHDGPKSGHH